MSEREREGHNERDQREEQLAPRIWVGSLADYNNGVLHGDWLDAAVADDVLLAGAQRILASSRQPDAEEWGIFDYDEFGSFKVGECDRLEDVTRVARGIAEHGAAFAAWAQLHDGHADMLDQFEDAYLGEYDSINDWAREVLDDFGIEEMLAAGVPESLLSYVRMDYEAWARDAVLGGDVYAEDKPEGGIWLFHSI